MKKVVYDVPINFIFSNFELRMTPDCVTPTTAAIFEFPSMLTFVRVIVSIIVTFELIPTIPPMLSDPIIAIRI